MDLERGDSHQRGGSAVFGEQERPEKYSGVERRRAHRRGQRDRREEMRFEMKADRRVIAGRRADDKDVKYW